MAIVYRYTNIFNGKSYIGQTKNPDIRKRSHIYASTSPQSPDYHRELYKDARKYGWESFEYEVLEVCEADESKYREDFYIRKYDSVESGYNSFYSGDHPTWSEEAKRFASENAEFKNALLTYEDLVYIRTAYLEGKRPSDIYPEYKDLITHYYSFMNIWTGTRYGYVMPEVFSIRSNRVKLDYEKAQDIRLLYQEDGATYAKIAEIYGVGRATVRDVIKNYTWKVKEPVSTISG